MAAVGQARPEHVSLEVFGDLLAKRPLRRAACSRWSGPLAQVTMSGLMP